MMIDGVFEPVMERVIVVSLIMVRHAMLSIDVGGMQVRVSVPEYLSGDAAEGRCIREKEFAC